MMALNETDNRRGMTDRPRSRNETIEDIGGRTAQLAETQVLDIYENVKKIFP
jgi:hypothetical protein